MFETIVAGILVGLAIFFAGLMAYRTIKGQGGGGCSCGNSLQCTLKDRCPSPPPEEQH